jgi:hypothetical protein
MSHNPGPFPRPNRPLDALVRAHLEAGAGVDGGAMLARARARRARWREARGRLLVGVPAALAAGLLGLLLLAPTGRAYASPAEVVAQAREAHEAPTDRAYRLRTELSGPLGQRLARWGLERDATLYTRGDRFRVEPGLGGRGAWGRDEKGNVWVAPTPRAGAAFTPEEVPPVFDELLALRSVDLPALLGVALRDCELRRPPWQPGDPLDTERIEAEPRHGEGRMGLVRAVLDIDPKQGVVRRLALKRRLPNGAFTLRLDLLGAQAQPDDSYRLQGHLGPGARRLDANQPAARALFLLKHHLGAIRKKAP